jgi:pimeloyl-ACP methyl ester carboxylesterase
MGAGTGARPQPPLRHHNPGRRWALGTATAAAGAVVGALAASGGPPVGHFRSGEAKDRFLRAYERAMAELPPPEQVLDVRTGFGVVRFYRFAGADPDLAPLVLLPGRAAASPVWAANVPSLRRLRSVYTVDLLGEPGLSIQDRPITTQADQAAWLHEALARLPEPRVHLVGLSIGGWTAINLVTRRPGKVTGVTLIDPVLVFAGIAPQVVVRSVPASVRGLPQSWRSSLARWTANDAPVTDVPVAAVIEEGMRSYALRLPTPRRIPEERLSGLPVPVQVILAGRSRMHDTAAAAQAARRALGPDRVTVYPGASHAINGEHPEEIAADVAAFLRDLDR